MGYGRIITEYGDIPDDEPVFIVRAQDGLAPELLRRYRSLCTEAGSPPYHLGVIDGDIRAFEEWQRDNPDTVRTPHSESSRERLPGLSARISAISISRWPLLSGADIYRRLPTRPAVTRRTGAPAKSAPASS